MFLFGIAIQIVILRPMIGEPIISVIMVTIALSTVFLRADEVDVRRQSAAVPAHLPDPERQHPRTAGADRLSDESCGLGGDDDRHGVVLPPLQIWPGDARHRIQPAGGAVARHFREKRVRDGLGDLGDRLRRRGRGGGRRQRRLGRAFRLRRQGVSGGDPGRLDSVGGAVLGGIIIGLLENFAHFLDSEYLHWGNLYEIARSMRSSSS
jgi:branched-chain amino acid transport system permease protein